MLVTISATSLTIERGLACRETKKIYTTGRPKKLDMDMKRLSLFIYHILAGTLVQLISLPLTQSSTSLSGMVAFDW